MDPFTIGALVFVGMVGAAVVSNGSERRRRRARAAKRTAKLAQYGLELVEDDSRLLYRRRGAVGPDALEAHVRDDVITVSARLDEPLLRVTTFAGRLNFTWLVNPQTHEPILPALDAVLVDLGNNLRVAGSPAAALRALLTEEFKETLRVVMVRRNSIVGQGGVRYARFDSSSTHVTLHFDLLHDGDLEADVKDVLDRCDRFVRDFTAAAAPLPVQREPAVVMQGPSVSTGGSPFAIPSHD